MLSRMAEDIRTAQSRVWLESYIFASDTAGRMIAQALIERAQAGVDVRLLYDAIGSQGTSTSLLSMMQAAGVQVHAYHSFLYALRNLSFFEILNRRNHRKLLVVDDRVAYFGGMNVVDTAPPPTRREQRRDLAEAGGWRDVHVRMSGPQVADVAESFERSWRRAHHQPIDRRPRSYRRVRLPRGAHDFIRFYDSGPGLNFSRAERVFTRIIGLARQSVIMSMAYFLPTGRVLRTLNRIGHRGARLTLVVPGTSDVPLVQRATRFLYGRLLERGVEIYERQRFNAAQQGDGGRRSFDGCRLVQSRPAQPRDQPGIRGRHPLGGHGARGGGNLRSRDRGKSSHHVGRSRPSRPVAEISGSLRVSVAPLAIISTRNLCVRGS